MSMTIKELADTLGVSKTAVRKHMSEDFRANYTEKDRKEVITIREDGCKLIAEMMGRSDKLPQQSENKFAETPETITIPRVVWLALERQLQEKDDQLKAKDLQIADLTATVRAQAQGVNQAQALHAGTMQQQLTAGTGSEEAAADVVADVTEPQKKKRTLAELFSWLSGKE